ncbi:ACP S-malonyltransferase [Dialister pneumosintes]|uniref:Malonyl CoA-acyl carrier protein transacylase n=1 Tax=Dialister pneumosintes TaxID=39950 RepID=A0ABX9MBA9_9FIRM|nr:ACP S-malonyltransferase [Dialister pneumosintes]RID94167.1 [acyl-carrier-protein] S-malonyltransferase [Dialister pneumosintes]
MKKAFLFPGQGSQKVGMVADLYEKYDAVKALLKEADNRLGFSISRMMFDGPDEELMKTEFTQPAILTASVAVSTILREHGLTPDVVAGHSLGEYSALVTAGALSFSDAIHVVHLRGKYMQEAVPLGEGGMAAIIALDAESIKDICNTISTEEKPVQAVNFNCPGQVVIAGATEAVKQACNAMKEAGAKMAVMLKVSAPFHSIMMEPAAVKLKEVLDTVTIQDAQMPVYANYNAAAEIKADDIRKNLVLQAAHPVLWDASIQQMIADGADLMIEAGPGTVLSGFMKRINRRIRTLHAEDVETVTNVLNTWEE